MAKKSKRGTGRPGSDRAERVAARKARQAQGLAAPARPFAGLAAECDLVALRAFVASATAAVTVQGDGVGTNAVSLATILPGAVQALTRDVGGSLEGLAALQTEFEATDIPGEIAHALRWASNAEAGAAYEPRPESAEETGEADLAAVLGVDTTLDITLHDDFSWWFADAADVSPDIAAMIEQASESIMPTARIGGSDSGLSGAPWWVDAGERAHVRWVRPESEDDVMTALARLHAAGKLTLGEGSKFAGSFRTHGLLVPVFDLDNEMHHEEWVEPCTRFEADLAEALAQTGELSGEQRRSRDGIRGRQVTLR